MKSPRIDSHQHFWRLDRGDYRWLTPRMSALYRDFSPRDLAPKLRQHSLDSTVLVQAADSIAETQFLLALADVNPFVAGVVGWIDFESPDAVPQLHAFAAHPKFAGVRPMLQDLADPRWILRAEFEPVLRAIVELDLVFDALAKPEHLAPLAELLARHPELRLVVDHGAKPAVAEGRAWSGFERWRAGLRELASHASLRCKLSGLASEAGPSWTVADLRPFADVLIETFGAERLLWGSDWPVVESARGYDAWVHAAEELTASLAPQDRAAIWGGNARSTYGLFPAQVS